ncbi:MAG: HAMP domain-containing protein, partial [Thermoanaerobacteraceae bacterium]|nr:HAMP domain-containing protein [Thermoanaerobacteraceae bacterium]
MQKRLVISFIIIMCLTLTLSYALFLNIYATHIIKIIKKDLYNDASQLFYFSTTQEDINDYIEHYISETGNNISVIKNGKVINSQSNVDEEIIDNLQDSLINRNKAELIKISGNDRLIAIGISLPDKTISVFISASYNKYAGFNIDEWTYLFAIFILCIVISTALWYRFIFYTTRSIKTITQAVNDITNGNYDEIIRYEYDDEIGKLVKAFNYMANKLKSIMKEMYDRNSKLEAVLKSIVNGVIAIDNHGRIILINDSAKKILDIADTDVMDKHLLEVIRNYKLSQSLDDYINNKTDINLDFEINLPQNKALKVYINPIIN